MTTANITDRNGSLEAFSLHQDQLSDIKNVLADGGYSGKPFAIAVKDLLGASVEIVKRNLLHTFVVLPKRWVVERSFGWLEKSRRLWKNCEREIGYKPSNGCAGFHCYPPQKIVNRLLKGEDTIFIVSFLRCCNLARIDRHKPGSLPRLKRR